MLTVVRGHGNSRHGLLRHLFRKRIFVLNEVVEVVCPSCGKQQPYIGQPLRCACGHKLTYPKDALPPKARWLRDMNRVSGWYTDPLGFWPWYVTHDAEMHQRYWDSQAWTARTRVLEGGLQILAVAAGSGAGMAWNGSMNGLTHRRIAAPIRTTTDAGAEMGVFIARCVA